MRKQMRQIIVMILMIAVLLCGCGSNETSVQEPKESETEQAVVKQDVSESIDGFQKPEYEKFNSYASDNGLGGTPIYVEGKVLNQTRLGDSTPPVLALVVEQEDGKRWCVSLTSDSEIEDIKEKNVRVFGSYQGYSDVMNLPAMVVAIEDDALIEKARVEVKENGDYNTVWSFMDYAKNEIEKENSSIEPESEEGKLNVIYSEKYKVDGEDVGMALSENNGGFDFSIIGHANTEEKASIMLATYINKLEKLTSLDSYRVCAFCGERFATYSKDSDGKTNTYGTNADGSMAFSSPDWLKTEITMSDSEFNIYVDELIAKLDDFFASNSNDKKHVKEGNDVSDVKVTGEYFYIRGEDKVRYFLVVKNTSEKILEVKANVIAKDRDGNILGAKSERLNAISPNQEMVMGFYFDDAGTAEKFEYDFENEESKYVTSYYDNLTWEMSINKNKLIVQITNNGSDDAKYVMPYALFFNNGEIFSHEYSGNVEIKAGKTVPVELECFDGEFEDYKLYISAWGNK